jgi:hypothetical protein
MERLAALVPPPRFNITRFFGVLAPASSFRPLIVLQDKHLSRQRIQAVGQEWNFPKQTQPKSNQSGANSREIIREDPESNRQHVLPILPLLVLLPIDDMIKQLSRPWFRIFVRVSQKQQIVHKHVCRQIYGLRYIFG